MVNGDGADVCWFGLICVDGPVMASFSLGLFGDEFTKQKLMDLF